MNLTVNIARRFYEGDGFRIHRKFVERRISNEIRHSYFD